MTRILKKIEIPFSDMFYLFIYTFGRIVRIKIRAQFFKANSIGSMSIPCSNCFQLFLLMKPDDYQLSDYIYETLMNTTTMYLPYQHRQSLYLLYRICGYKTLSIW